MDVSLLTIEAGILEVQATVGDTHLGGEDFDNHVVVFCMQDFKRKVAVRARRRYRPSVAKRTLSFPTQATVELYSPFDGIDYSCTLSRRAPLDS